MLEEGDEVEVRGDFLGVLGEVEVGVCAIHGGHDEELGDGEGAGDEGGIDDGDALEDAGHAPGIELRESWDGVEGWSFFRRNGGGSEGDGGAAQELGAEGFGGGLVIGIAAEGWDELEG